MGVCDQVDEVGSDMFSDKYGREDNASPNAKPIHGTFSCKILIKLLFLQPFSTEFQWNGNKLSVVQQKRTSCCFSSQLLLL